MSVLIFLLVVAAGFVLLAFKIIREKSLLWLVGANALSVLTIFYVVQFLDLDGMAANYNVARWEREPNRTLDFDYLRAVGSNGWQALRRVEGNPDRPAEAAKARDILGDEHEKFALIVADTHWRSWQARYAKNLPYAPYNLNVP